MNSTAAALALLALAAGPGAHRTGSAQIQVSVRVIAPMSASAPSVAELRAVEAAMTPTVNVTLRAQPAEQRADGQRVVARLFPTAARRGGAPGALIGVVGGPSQRCADAGACEVSFTRAATDAADDRTLVVTFLPDGAPPSLVER